VNIAAAAGGARVPDPVHGTADAAPDPAPGLDLATVDPVPIQRIAPSRGRETKSAALVPAPAPAPGQTTARGGVPAVPMIKTPRRETWTCRSGNNLSWAGWRGQPVVQGWIDSPATPSLFLETQTMLRVLNRLSLYLHYIIHYLSLLMKMVKIFFSQFFQGLTMGESERRCAI